MSNHDGSYLLNEVLRLFEERGLFPTQATPAIQQILSDVVRLADEYDCNSHEILSGLGERFHVCESCTNPCEALEDGRCQSCNTED